MTDEPTVVDYYGKVLTTKFCDFTKEVLFKHINKLRTQEGHTKLVVIFTSRELNWSIKRLITHTCKMCGEQKEEQNVEIVTSSYYPAGLWMITNGSSGIVGHLDIAEYYNSKKEVLK